MSKFGWIEIGDEYLNLNTVNSIRKNITEDESTNTIVLSLPTIGTRYIAQKDNPEAFELILDWIEAKLVY